MTIRRAAPADLPGVMAIERACFSVPWSEEGMRFELESGDSVFLVAEADGIAGFAILHRSFDEGEVYNIAVREDCRCAGLGRQLLLRALSEAGALGVRRVYLEVRRSNDAARHLYQSCGFAVCGLRKGYYDAPREDAVLMDWEAAVSR